MAFFLKKWLEAATKGSMMRAADFAANEGVPRDFSLPMISEVTQITQYVKFLGTQNSEFRMADGYKQYGHALQLMYERFLSGETISLRDKAPTKTQLVDNKNGTVTDTTTGLMWQQAETGTEKTWEEAIDYCKALGLAGYNDWRLPDRNELESLVDTRYYDPCIDKTIFPGDMLSSYWSSNTNTINTDYAWIINFNQCIVCNGYKLSKFYSMRAVRGGKGYLSKNETPAVVCSPVEQTEEEKSLSERLKEQRPIRAKRPRSNDNVFSIYTCPVCDGEGQMYISEDSLAICERCDGKGLIEDYCFDGIQTYLSYMQRANTYYESKQFSEAIEILQRATCIDPESVEAWLFLGIIYNEYNQKTKAIQAYEKGLSINPELADVWFNLGILYDKSNQNTKAIEAYKQATSVNPEFPNAWFNLGIAYINSDQFTKAIEAYEKGLSINPKFPNAWFNLGILYDKSNQNTKAIEAYKQATSVNPESVEAWFNLGMIYNKSNQFTKAIEPYKQTIRINPQNIEAWCNLGLSYQNTNQHKKALEVYKQATHIDSGFAKAWFNLGVCYVESNQYKEAVNSYKIAARIDPECIEAWNNLGTIYNKASQFTNAIDALKQAIRINPEDADAWFNIGISYKYSGQTNLSMKVYKRLKVLDPVMADNFNKVKIPR